MKIILLNFISFVCIQTAFSQHNLSITPSLGISKIAIRADYLKPFKLNQETSTRFRESFGLNVDYRYDFNKISISTGLGLTTISGKQEETFIKESFNGAFYESTTMNLAKNRSTLYASLPLVFSITNNKLTFGIGYQIMASLSSRTQVMRYADIDSENPTLLSDYPAGKTTRSIDYGAIFQCGYQIMPRATIIAKAYIGVNDISYGNEIRQASSFPNPPSTHQLYSRQFTIGFSYQFLRRPV
ncbi:outer membrane beta-barrel protein [Crocinitomix catalasitica]|uniref:outer membrane beta-barrel protein n=1 Tax=Crocinitomix catalasitica TaxID=184607 RepID=UPI000483F39E|nr:outer membrane beta-barrel protein [Crocinitomix catalasitica]